MDIFKLMPAEATPEMEQAAEKYWNDRRFKGLSEDPRTWKGVYAAFRSAAPAVQGEPVLVGYIRRSAIELMENDELGVRANIIKEPRYRDCVALYDGPIADEQASPQDEQEAFEQYYHRLDLSRDLVSGAYLDREVRSLWDAWQARAELAASACSQPAEQKPAPDVTAPSAKFKRGDSVRKIKGSQWKGRVVGTYSTELTPEGYAVESDTEKGSVQIYPAAALELATDDEQRAPAAPDVSALVEALEWIAGADCEPGEGATDFAVAMGRGIAIGNIHRKASEALAAYWKGGEQ